MNQIAALLSEAIGSDGMQLWDAVEPRQQLQVMSTIAAEAPPACVALPNTTEQLGQVMAIAAQQGWRVLPMGQGSKLGWGGLAHGIDIVISTARLNQIVEHAVGDYTVTVQPGLKIAALQQVLAEQQQFLAIDPAFDQLASVGGVVATADTGSLRQRYGGLRDMLIGVQFARYDGELARAGGRVVKNVAGYDLMKLLTGSYGSLGILSELTFRLYPMQRCSRSLLLSAGLQAIEAATAEVRLSGLTPVAMDVVVDHTATERMSLVARFQGIEAGVEEQTERLKKIATTHGMACKQLDGEADEAYWRHSAQVIRADTVLCKVGLRPSGIPWLVELADMVFPGAQVRLYGSSGLGWIQVEIAERLSDERLADELIEGLGKVRSHCQKNAGFLTVLQAPKAVKAALDVWGYEGNALNVMKSIKEKFDPNQQLSPGRFVGGL